MLGPNLRSGGHMGTITSFPFLGNLSGLMEDRDKPEYTEPIKKEWPFKVVYPKQLSRIRQQLKRGEMDSKTINIWLKSFAQELRGLSVLYDETAVDRFCSFMRYQIYGRDVEGDLRTNLWITSFKVQGKHKVVERLPYEEIVIRYDAIVKKQLLNLPYPSSLLDAIILDVEEDNRMKVGPRALYRPYAKDGFNKVIAIAAKKPVPDKLDRKIARLVFEKIAGEVREGSITFEDYDEISRSGSSMLDDVNMLGNSLRSKTNSGAPFLEGAWRATEGMTLKQAEKADSVRRYYVKICELERPQLIRGIIPKWYGVFGIRTSPSRGLYPLKTVKNKRVIVMMPKNGLFHGRQIYPKAMAQRRTLRYGQARSLVHIAWSDIPAIDLEMQRFLNWCKASQLVPISTDFAAYDTSVVSELWYEMAEARNKWIVGGGKFISSLARAASNAAILTPLEIVESEGGSIHSGDWDTNGADSDLNKAVWLYGYYAGVWGEPSFYVQGDDGVGAAKGVDPESFAAVASLFGYSANAEKQYYKADKVTFLQRLHIRGHLGGVYSTYRALSSCIGLEHLRVEPKKMNPYVQALEIISRLLNASFNPLLGSLVEFVKHADEYELGAKLPAREVIKRAGESAAEVLLDPSTLTASVASSDLGEWGRNVINLALRGEILPIIGGVDYFSLVYGQKRVSKSEELVGLSVKEIANGGY
uniref:RNA-dependent RNA polymerase n=1 Tax=Cryptotermes secundus picobirna-like virus 1 TaxID=3133502 RepID=A0AAT9JGA1_9VIRU